MPRRIVPDGRAGVIPGQIFDGAVGKVRDGAAVVIQQDRPEGPGLPCASKGLVDLVLGAQLPAAEAAHAAVLIEHTEVVAADAAVENGAVADGCDALLGIEIPVHREGGVHGSDRVPDLGRLVPGDRRVVRVPGAETVHVGNIEIRENIRTGEHSVGFVVLLQEDDRVRSEIYTVVKAPLRLRQ